MKVTITEVDTAAVSIDPTALTVAEGDADGASYSVVLGSEPTAEVTVEISGHVGTDLSLSGPTLSATNSLTFTPADWSTAQTVTVTASEDDDAVSDGLVTLTHAVAGSGEYQGVAAASVTVTITEVDTAAVSINPTALTVAEGDSGSYSVVLDSEPTAEVTVTVGGHVGTDVTVSDAMLTFTPANWSTAQTVTVTASEDDDAAEDPDMILTPRRHRVR